MEQTQQKMEHVYNGREGLKVFWVMLILLDFAMSSTNWVGAGYVDGDGGDVLQGGNRHQPRE